MNLDTVRTALDIIVVGFALPLAGWRVWRKIDQKLSRIEYALFNDGRGMEQQLKEVHKNQQTLITDVAVLKAVRTGI